MIAGKGSASVMYSSTSQKPIGEGFSRKAAAILATRPWQGTSVRIRQLAASWLSQNSDTPNKPARRRGER